MPSGDYNVHVGVVQSIEQHVDTIFVLGGCRAGHTGPGGNHMRLRARDALDHILEGGAAGKHVADAECRRNAEVPRKTDAVEAPIEQNGR